MKYCLSKLHYKLVIQTTIRKGDTCKHMSQRVTHLSRARLAPRRKHMGGETYGRCSTCLPIRRANKLATAFIVLFLGGGCSNAHVRTRPSSELALLFRLGSKEKPKETTQWLVDLPCLVRNPPPLNIVRREFPCSSGAKGSTRKLGRPLSQG